MFGRFASMLKSLLALGVLGLVAPLALACSVSSILTAVVGTPTPAPTATSAAPINIVTNAVTAKDVSGDDINPVGITDSFPANQSIFHVVVTISGAPDNTNVRVNWLTASSIAMGDFALMASGTRNLDFSFKPDTGKLPPGAYQAQIYVNDVLDRTLSFTVLPPASAPTPVATAPKPSGFIDGVTMATDTTGVNFDPVNPTVVFKPTDVFHAVAALSKAPPNTKFTAAWYVVDVGEASPPNSLLDSTDISTDGPRNIDFRLSTKTTWPVGTYRVEISVNGIQDTVKTFSVK